MSRGAGGWFRCGAVTAIAAVAMLAAVANCADTPAPQQSFAPAPSHRYDRTDGTIKFWQWKVSRDPDDYFSYDRLGAAYIQKARETGDITYYTLAEQALGRSLALESKDREAVSALAHMATVYFGEHRFPEAIDYAQRAAALKTGDVSQYAIIGDAQLEMGEYGKAEKSFTKLRAAADTPEHANSRIAYLAESRWAALDFIEGRAARSEAELRAAIDSAIAVQAPAENIAWTQFMLGEELFLTGDLAGAENSYQASLASYPGFHRALSGLAKVSAAQHKYDQAAGFYEQALGVIPLPIYAAALGDVYGKMERADDAGKQYELVEYIARINAMNKIVYNRELALFYADHDLHLPDSVDLARKELQVRKDVYTWDVYAFALYKNGRASEAAEADAHALKLGTPDPLLYFHAGMIAGALGEHAKEREYLRHALALNPDFHVLYADVARRDLHEVADRSDAIAQAPSNKGIRDAR
jgi:tetratricopeptide (TPR) repeat protein